MPQERCCGTIGILENRAHHLIGWVFSPRSGHLAFSTEAVYKNQRVTTLSLQGRGVEVESQSKRRIAPIHGHPKPGRELGPPTNKMLFPLRWGEEFSTLSRMCSPEHT